MSANVMDNARGKDMTDYHITLSGEVIVYPYTDITHIYIIIHITLPRNSSLSLNLMQQILFRCLIKNSSKILNLIYQDNPKTSSCP